MKLPFHGRRMVLAVLLLGQGLSGCTAARSWRVGRQPTASSPSEHDVVEPPTEPRAAKTKTVRQVSETQSPDDSSASIVLATAVDQPSPGDKIEGVPESSPIVGGNAGVMEAANLVPMDLSTVLSLTDGQNPQVGLARERIAEAYAQVNRAETLWLPSLRVGMNYNQHTGAIQNVAGDVINTNRSSAFGGFGAGAYGAASPSVPGLMANFHLTDAIFQPKIARHQASSRQFAATATRNDILSDSAVAYLELLRAERRLAIALEAKEKTNRIATLTGEYARTGQGSMADHDRLLAELAARDNEVTQAEELAQTTSSRLAYLMHFDPSVTLSAHEPIVAPLDLMAIESTTQELVARGLSRRPELAEHRQLVCEACERLRREKYAPLVPSVLLGLSYGGYGGGLGNSFANGSDRFDADAIAYWEVRNLGFGDQSARNEATSRVRQARMREVTALDKVAQEVVESQAQVKARRKRIEATKPGITTAERSYDLNLERIENARGLPIEALQSVQALTQARRDYLNAVIDYNIAQIRLCRATGWFDESNL